MHSTRSHTHHLLASPFLYNTVWCCFSPFDQKLRLRSPHFDLEKVILLTPRSGMTVPFPHSSGSPPTLLRFHDHQRLASRLRKRVRNKGEKSAFGKLRRSSLPLSAFDIRDTTVRPLRLHFPTERFCSNSSVRQRQWKAGMVSGQSTVCQMQIETVENGHVKGCACAVSGLQLHGPSDPARGLLPVS